MALGARVRLMLAREYEHEYLEGRLAICPLSQTAKVAASPETKACDFSIHRLLSKFIALGLSPNRQKTVGHPPVMSLFHQCVPTFLFCFCDSIIYI